LSYARKLVAHCNSALRSVATSRIYDRLCCVSASHSRVAFIAPVRTVSRPNCWGHGSGSWRGAGGPHSPTFVIGLVILLLNRRVQREADTAAAKTGLNVRGAKA